jgi:xanthine dehydrogenase small subunit
MSGLGAVRFWFGGERRTVTGLSPTTSVLSWLRESEHLPGTKEGCGVGECGSCTVVVGELVGRAGDPQRGNVRLHPATACLLLVPQLHGRALFTVEDVAGEALHPVQQALVDAGGSQCGFCTPGVVMALWCAAEESRRTGTRPDDDALTCALSGNLCRCTGYRPILEAGRRAVAEVAVGAGTGPDLAAVGRALSGIATTRDLALAAPESTWLAPASVAGVVDALRTHPGARILSGGTDLVPLLRAAGEDSSHVVLVSTDQVASMRRLDAGDAHLHLGAAATIEDAWAALAERAPALRTMWHRFGSPAIRAVGTVGGNLANASPVADLVPALLALDAEVCLVGPDGERHVPVERLTTGVRRTVLRPAEVITRVDVPLGAFERDLRSYKVSRRYDDDISTVSATFALAQDDAGRVTSVRIVFGGTAPTVARCPAAEAAVIGHLWDQQTLDAALAALEADLAPVSDVRASAGYRRLVAAGLLRRWWLETSPHAPAVPLDVRSAS